MGTAEQRGAAASELAASRNVPVSINTEAVEAESIGRFLCRERQVRGIELDELVAVTRLPRRSLERLEAGEMDGECDGFARGLVRTVAQALGLPVDDTVARMLPEERRGAERRRFLRLGFLRMVPMTAWLVAVAALAAAAWWLATASAGVPDPLLYRRDAVRELWLIQQQHSSWSPAPALATSVSPTVEPESPRSVISEDGDRSP